MYNLKRTKNNFKTNKILLFFNYSTKYNYIKFDQEIKHKNLKYYSLKIKLIKKIIKTSALKLLRNHFNNHMITCYLKTINEILTHKQLLISEDFYLLKLKLNNRLYSIPQLNTLTKLDYNYSITNVYLFILNLKRIIMKINIGTM